MPAYPFRILQVNAVDTLGGAARIAWTLHQSFRQRGHEAWMTVGRKYSEDQTVYRLPGLPPQTMHGRFFYGLSQKMEGGPARLGTLTTADILRRLAEPVRYWNRYWGKDDFDQRGTWQLLDIAGVYPDIVHLHNLHSDYFDLRYLPELSASVPTICTLHDTWLLSGHCAYPLDCERWKTGCGECPYLEIYPSVKHDATAYNWKMKQEIYNRSRVYVAAPSKWVLDQAKQSMFAPAIRRSQVIHNGVDLSVFHPEDKQKVRSVLGIPTDADVLLFVAGGLQNVFKDFRTIQGAVQQLASRAGERQLIFLALGGDGSIQHIGNVEVRSVPFVNDPKQVANYYRAADIYMHAARVDTFPNVILEAIACGTPVVATAVGGIPEQIVEGQTGFLIPPGDSEAMAVSVRRLLDDENLRSRMRRAAASYAAMNFGLERMIDDYLDFYQEMLGDWQNGHTARNLF